MTWTSPEGEQDEGVPGTSTVDIPATLARRLLHSEPWAGPPASRVLSGNAIADSRLAPVFHARGLSERVRSRSRTPDLGQRRTRQAHRLECAFTCRMYTREATKTGLKWPFTGGCVGKHEESGLEDGRRRVDDVVVVVGDHQNPPLVERGARMRDTHLHRGAYRQVLG